MRPPPLPSPPAFCISSTMMTPEAIPHLKETQSIFLIGWMPNRGAPYLDFWRWFVCLVGPLYAPRTGPMGVHMGMFGCASLSLLFFVLVPTSFLFRHYGRPYGWPDA